MIDICSIETAHTKVKERMVTRSLAELLTERAAKQPGQLGYRYFSGATGYFANVAGLLS
jgi:hypothetical protein